MYYTINRINNPEGNCVTISVRESKDAAVDFARKYIESFIKKWDGQAHLRDCSCDHDKLIKLKKGEINDAKHYIETDKRNVIVYKNTKLSDEGLFYNSERYEINEVFKISISEVHGLADKSKNVEFNIYDDVIKVVNFDDVMDELKIRFSSS